MEKLHRHGNKTDKFVKKEMFGKGGAGEGKSCNHCYKSADNLPLLRLLQTTLHYV